MLKLNRWFNLTRTPQTAPMPNSDQVMNNAGGYAWALDAWQMLDRFLLFGTEGGTYYADERTLTVEQAGNVLAVLQADGMRAVRRIVEISRAGRAYKNDPALFALALAFAAGDDAVRGAAATALPQVARTGTHLFTFLTYAEDMRGWGRGLRRAVAGWYNAQTPEALAYQVTKYAQRQGWTHRDALRLAHPKAGDEAHNTLYAYITGKGALPEGTGKTPWGYLNAVAAVSDPATSLQEVCRLIIEYRLPREVVPTPLLQQAAVWEALLQQMPMTAMIRNLATLTRTGVLAPMSDWVHTVAERLVDRERLHKARIHPIQVLAALKTYASGHGERGQQSWAPVQAIVDALDAAFYLTFDNVEPTGLRILLAVDVSGSMSWGTLGGVRGLTPRDAAAALALVTAARESHSHVMGFSTAFMPLDISPHRRLDDVVTYMCGLPFGGTDCALPMTWALEQRMPVDAFVVLTDNQTWAGEIHPAQALTAYRRQMGLAAKMIVVGMTSNGFTIGDPRDAGTLNVVGFSPEVPYVMNDFMRGEI